MKNHWIRRALLLLLTSALLMGVTVAATGGAGSKEDPLVTLSYLTKTFQPDVMAQVDKKLAERDTALAAKLAETVAADKKELEKNYGSGSGSSGETDGFAVVTMSRGQVLSGGIGCEVMLRVGSASCVSPSSPGLIDSTDASTLDNGKSLVKNHLYMMTIEDRGVKAAADTVKLLVRGSYTVK